MIEISDIINYLKKWAIDYEKHRDIINKHIESIDEDDDFNLIIKYKDKEKGILIIPVLEDAKSLRVKLKEKDMITLITINSKENVDFLVDNWKMFNDIPGCTMMFINPFSELENKWMIKPYVHNMITENEALKTGIKSMSATVDYITDKEFSKNI